MQSERSDTGPDTLRILHLRVEGLDVHGCSIHVFFVYEISIVANECT